MYKCDLIERIFYRKIVDRVLIYTVRLNPEEFILMSLDAINIIPTRLISHF